MNYQEEIFNNEKEVKLKKKLRESLYEQEIKYTLNKIIIMTEFFYKDFIKSMEKTNNLNNVSIEYDSKTLKKFKKLLKNLKSFENTQKIKKSFKDTNLETRLIITKTIKFLREELDKVSKIEFNNCNMEVELLTIRYKIYDFLEEILENEEVKKIINKKENFKTDQSYKEKNYVQDWNKMMEKNLKEAGFTPEN